MMAGVALLAVLAEAGFRPGVPDRAVTLAVALAVVPALLWRRQRPLLMVAVVFGAAFVAPLFTGRQPELVSGATVLLLAYALVRWGSGREILAGAALILAKISVSGLAGVFGLGWSIGPTDVVAGFVVMFAVFAVAAAARYRSRLRARELDQAKLLERERLARDLHDTVAHHVSAMAIRAQAGIAVSRTEPAGAIDALRVIEAEAVRALGEMRTMVRTLRGTEPADLAPSPSLADLAGLAGRPPESLSREEAALPGRTPEGPPVEVELTGDVDGVPVAVATAVYRLAQESVTNARRHARNATRIVVRVTASDETVRLRVTDDGEGGATGAGGYGLVGMRERAALLGGVCEAGPSSGRGWTVTATLPTGAA
ncbi:histidine kinase [Actinoplanes utahensis]|nr:two-component sensor histidine kinase [Actinoplanes utahensis]